MAQHFHVPFSPANVTKMHLYYFIPPVLAAALLFPQLCSGFFHRAGMMLNRIAMRPWRCVMLVGVLSFALQAFIGWQHKPAFQVADEFGYELIADTFAHGRVTNPTHPMWEFFESIHIIQKPTYTSKYPPGQGLAMAAGELFGHPIYGVWFTGALACATVCWMLMAWMPNRWALVGGLLSVIHPLTLLWSQGYWGGAVAMGGGAILLGAFRRLLRKPRVRDAVWLGVAMLILANSRPYEGFVLSAIVLVTLVILLLKSRVPFMGLVRVVALPLAGMLFVTAGVVGFYNHRVTGSVLRMPYIVHEEQYGIAPLFVFDHKRPEPVYRHKEIRDLQRRYAAFYDRQKTPGGLVRASERKLLTVLKACSWSGLMLLPLLGLPWALRRDRWLIFAVLIGAFFTAAMLLGTWVFPHYAAPAVGLSMAIVIQSLRHLRIWRRGDRRRGLAVCRAIYALAVLSTIPVAWQLMHPDLNAWFYRREAIIHKLEAMGGRHLVVVHYSPKHNPHREWVYNSADIDTAPIVFAREMEPEEMKKLFAYFKKQDRKVWVVDADAPHPDARPWGGAQEIRRSEKQEQPES